MSIKEIEKKLEAQFARVEQIAYLNQKKVLQAFIDNKVSTACFAGTTGYGYDDVGRETLAKLYAQIFGTETAIVSPLITCGSHAISTVLYGLLRPGDVLLSATGKLYDTLQDTLFGKDNGSLEEFGVKYEQVELIGDDIDTKTKGGILPKVKRIFEPQGVFSGSVSASI